MNDSSIHSKEIKEMNKAPIFQTLHRNISKRQSSRLSLTFIEAVNSKGNHYFFNENNKKYMVNIMKYLSFNDIINIKRCSKGIYKLINKEILLNLIRKGIISYKDRKSLWINNINLKNIKNLVISELKSISNCNESNVYSCILSISSSFKNETNGVDKNNRPIKTAFSKSVDEISRDLSRTFHEEKFSSSDFQVKLERILSSIAYIRPEIGYCQGMNFVASALFEFLEDEELSFWVFLYFLDEMELNSLYFENMPDYSIRIYQLNYYIKKHIPSLYSHFLKNQINPDLILSKWILTIFSSFLPFIILSKIWDIFIFDRWKALITFSIILLYDYKDTFLQMDLQKISKFIRENSRKEYFDYQKAIDMYDEFVMSNEELDDLRDEYFKDLAMKKLDSNDASQWETDQEEAVGIFKSSMNKLSLEFKEVISKYKNKVEYYDKLYKIGKEAMIKVNSNSLERKLDLEELIESRTAQENLLLILNGKEEKKDKLKVSKKLVEINKKIEVLNKELLGQYRLLDEKKDYLGRIKKKLFQYKSLFEETMSFIKVEENKITKQFSERLKLTEKFVRTSQF